MIYALHTSVKIGAQASRVGKGESHGSVKIFV